MAHPPGAMRQPPTRPPSRPASLEQPQPVVEVVPPPPENTWPCGCAYPGAHHTDCMWSLWEQMRANYVQTKTLMGQFMTQVDGLQTDAKTKAECECPSSCHGKDLGKAMGLQQMQGVTVPWLQPPSNAAGAAAPPSGLPDAGNYVSESRKLVEEQQRIKKTWAQFLNIFDIALDMANDVSKDRWEATRRRKERERLERQERKEEERRERQERREKCAEERTKSKDEDGEGEEGDKQQQQKQQPEGEKKNKEKAAEKQSDKAAEKKRESRQRESRQSEAKSQPATPTRKSTKRSVEEEAAREELEESPQPEETEDAVGAEVTEGGAEVTEGGAEAAEPPADE